VKRRNERRGEVMSDITLTNLIDVIFAVLIIFMRTAPMMTQGVQVDLPETESKSVESNVSIQVTIDDRNDIYIDQELVSLVEFRKRFREVFAGRDDVPVFVNADRKVPYGIVVRVISEIQNAGVIKLGFLTTPLDITGGR
jgi:biopolymer transport protein ExbD/biopolymer transport protein TolR